MDENLDLNKNLEIKEALREFEAKNSEQIQQIPEVLENSETPKMVQFVIKHSRGIIKNEKQAEYTLLIFAILMIAGSFFLIFGGGTADIPKDIKILPAEF